MQSFHIDYKASFPQLYIIFLLAKEIVKVILFLRVFLIQFSNKKQMKIWQIPPLHLILRYLLLIFWIFCIMLKWILKKLL